MHRRSTEKKNRSNLVERDTLDYLIDGRFILGAGSGAYQADMHILGIDPATTRNRLRESLEVIQPLLRGEKISAKADWFEMKDARVRRS